MPNKETVEEFLKRGGKINKIPRGVGVGFKPSNTIAGNRRRKKEGSIERS
tara:strand:- start:1868 stop:2017 length:150 start_codon:yes stop_codon:yes gene_type:complete